MSTRKKKSKPAAKPRQPTKAAAKPVKKTAARAPTLIDRVQAVYACFGGGDLPGLLALLAEDVIWNFPGDPAVPLSGWRRGRAAVGEWFKTLGESFEYEGFDIDRFIADDTVVVALGHERAIIRRTGKRFDSAFVHVWTFSGGEIISFRDALDSWALSSAFKTG